MEFLINFELYSNFKLVTRNRHARAYTQVHKCTRADHAVSFDLTNTKWRKYIKMSARDFLAV
jgi:hypothetical protein